MNEVKSRSISFLAAVVLVSILLAPTSAQSTQTQVSYTVNLNSFNLKVTYPSEVTPGNNVTISILGTPKAADVYLQTLTVTVYYADASGLHQLASQALVNNQANSYSYYGTSMTGNITKTLSVNIPQNAPRTSLVALFFETTQFNNYNYYDDYGPYPFSYWYYRDPIFLSYYPSYSAETDQAISPLSYINATTPEYVALQSEYQQLQQQLNHAQTQNQQLQTSITQQNATISQLNQQLTSANTNSQNYETAAVLFAIIAVALAVLSIYEIRSKGKLKTSNETKPSA